MLCRKETVKAREGKAPEPGGVWAQAVKEERKEPAGAKAEERRAGVEEGGTGNQ